MRTLIVALAILLASSFCEAQTDTFGTTPTLLDCDFTKITSTTDPKFSTYWNLYDATDSYGDTTSFSASNISFSNTDGLVLKITPSPTYPNGGKPIGSGVKSAIRYIYGRYEIVARVPGSVTPHASAWLLGAGEDVHINGYREVDIFEHATFGGGQNSVQVNAYIQKNGVLDKANIFRGNGTFASSNDFQTFRIDWTPKKVKFYVSGAYIGEANSATQIGNPPNVKTPLKNDMRIRLDIARDKNQSANDFSSSHSLRIRSVKVYPMLTTP
jgi:beta-glucanase (GH16 family)